MDRKVLWRVLLIVIAVGLAIWSLYPPQERIHLGLDLRGGIHLVLEVQTDDAVKAELDDAGQRLVTAASEKGITVNEVVSDPGEERLSFPVGHDVDRGVLREVVGDTVPDFKLNQGADTWTLGLPTGLGDTIRDMAVRQALETIRNRVDEFGVAEPVIQRQGLDSDRILIQLPGVDDPQRVKELVSNTAFLEFKEVVRGPSGSRQELIDSYDGRIPADLEILPGDKKNLDGQTIGTEYYVVRKSAIITGRELRNARRSQDQYQQPVVNFSLVPAASEEFAEYTGGHVGSRMAIVLDGNVASAPSIKSRIPRGEGRIEGQYTVEEAEDLALVLRAGALPAKIVYLEERTVGPSLGRDSVNRGVKAGIWGLIAVMVFMLIYYRFSGLNANVALILNIVILLGAMAYFSATLTLPGIAGLILTIGMAVDANVLIFERIREELAIGKTVRSAIDTGFSRAFGTIIDANITTLVAALFLFKFGTGPVKGFAVTLTIGIIASLFTAVFVSRTIYMILVESKDRVATLSI